MKNFQKIKFRQNEDKRTTVAVLEFEDVEHEAGKIWDDWYFDMFDKMLKNRKNKCYTVPPFVAVTHCANGDTWNPEIGLRVARSKLDMMIYKAKRKFISKCLAECIDRMTMLNNELSYVNTQIREEKERYISIEKEYKNNDTKVN